MKLAILAALVRFGGVVRRSGNIFVEPRKSEVVTTTQPQHQMVFSVAGHNKERTIVKLQETNFETFFLCV